MSPTRAKWFPIGGFALVKLLRDCLGPQHKADSTVIQQPCTFDQSMPKQTQGWGAEDSS